MLPPSRKRASAFSAAGDDRLSQFALFRHHCDPVRINRLTSFFTIDFCPDRIPKTRRLLPFVYQTRIFPFQQKRNAICHSKILDASVGISHVQDAFCVANTNSCLAAPFRTKEQRAVSPGLQYGVAPKNAELLDESGELALFSGETAADVAYNETQRNAEPRCPRNSLFLRRRGADGSAGR